MWKTNSAVGLNWGRKRLEFGLGWCFWGVVERAVNRLQQSDLIDGGLGLDFWTLQVTQNKDLLKSISKDGALAHHQFVSTYQNATYEGDLRATVKRYKQTT